MKRFPLYCVVVAGVLLAASAQSAAFKGHPMLAGFPTEEYSDWQWYGLVNGATIHRLTGLPQAFRPVALSVNDFHFSLLASSLFELKVGAGRLVVCGYDLESDAPVGAAAVRRWSEDLGEWIRRIRRGPMMVDGACGDS